MMHWYQKLYHVMFHWDYIYFHGQIFSGPMRVHFAPNGEAFIQRQTIIHLPNKIPPEGITIDAENTQVKIVPLTQGITWYKGEE